MKLVAYDGLENCKIVKKLSGEADCRLVIGFQKKKLESLLRAELPEWQVIKWNEKTPAVAKYETENGSLWVILQSREKAAQGSVDFGPYARMRDSVGSCLVAISKEESVQTVAIESLEELSAENLKGILVGVSLAQYRFQSDSSPLAVELKLPGLKKALLDQASALASGVNLARYLVDLPPNQLHPKSYSLGVKALFKGLENCQVDVWNQARLEKEGMGLHVAVGQAAENAPCLVHIKYRPRSSKKPVAFVGKGITFDSGGLDLKPAGPMRNMKKDMGGSAAVVGLAHSMIRNKVKQPADFYLALAENAVSSNAFRPGDVLTSRSGQTVEIHNTDAEGRLVLADAIDVAVTATGANKPSMVIDVATLTGAIKVGLGSDIGGLFANDDSLAKKIQSASYRSGDVLWQMPLFRGYRKKLSSHVASMANATDGFGGAVTAALFLESFVRDVPWAHLDIFAWTGAEGCYAQPGGSGQAVQCLWDFVSGLK